MGRIILPGEAQRRPGLTIIVPGDPGEPIGGCNICGALFFDGQERTFERHVGECAQAHIDELRAGSPRARLPILDPNTWDPEIDAHMRKVGDRMMEEGRTVMRDSERAGL